jgi:hypothetical protein
MADHTPVNLPDEFEALLRDSMAVEPTPQFAARVRQQIELAPRKTRWTWTWLLAAGAAVAVLLAVVLPMSINEAVSPARPLGPPSQVEAAKVEPRESAAAPPRTRVEAQRLPVEPRRAHTPKSHVVASHEPRRSEFPTVMVDPRQRAALTALTRLGWQGTVSEEVLEKLAAAPASVPAAIAVDPLVVSPIAVGGVLQYEIERR